MSDTSLSAEEVASTEAAMEAAGVATTERVQANYFGFEETHKVFFPDGVTYIMHKTLNEGGRRKYLDAVNRDIRLQKTTGDAIMKMQAGSEKHVLLKAAICGWNLLGPKGSELPFTPQNVDKILNEFDPSLIDRIEKDVRKKNVWLMADLSVEDIQKQIDELQEMLETKKKEEEGKDS